jgi:hypothetical protein
MKMVHKDCATVFDTSQTVFCPKCGEVANPKIEADDIDSLLELIDGLNITSENGNADPEMTKLREGK